MDKRASDGHQDYHRSTHPPKETMSEYTLPEDKVTMYVTNYCPYCNAAKSYLKQLNVEYDVVDVSNDTERRNWLVQTTGMRTVPQIFVGNTAVGGFTDMRALDGKGGFKPLLEKAGIPFG
jgi:glutaredoxin 3